MWSWQLYLINSQKSGMKKSECTNKKVPRLAHPGYILYRGSLKTFCDQYLDFVPAIRSSIKSLDVFRRRRDRLKEFSLNASKEMGKQWSKSSKSFYFLFLKALPSRHKSTALFSILRPSGPGHTTKSDEFLEKIPNGL